MANYTFDEIHQQPAMWRKEYAALLGAKAEVSAFMHKYLTPDTDVVLTGAGTSAFIGDALLPVMRGMWRNVRSVPTTDLITHSEYLLDKERPLLMISFARSGNSPESVGAVNMANKLCKGKNEKEAFEAVCNYMKSNFVYDYVKAVQVKAGMLPDIDGTFSKRMGVCQDLAAVMACMLRAQGIPCKLMIGYADKTYHAWTMTIVDGQEQFFDPTAALNAINKVKQYTLERFY